MFGTGPNALVFDFALLADLCIFVVFIIYISTFFNFIFKEVIGRILDFNS